MSRCWTAWRVCLSQDLIESPGVSRRDGSNRTVCPHLDNGIFPCGFILSPAMIWQRERRRGVERLNPELLSRPLEPRYFAPLGSHSRERSSAAKPCPVFSAPLPLWPAASTRCPRAPSPSRPAAWHVSRQNVLLFPDPRHELRGWICQLVRLAPTLTFPSVVLPQPTPTPLPRWLTPGWTRRTPGTGRRST